MKALLKWLFSLLKEIFCFSDEVDRLGGTDLRERIMHLEEDLDFEEDLVVRSDIKKDLRVCEESLRRVADRIKARDLYEQEMTH